MKAPRLPTLLLLLALATLFLPGGDRGSFYRHEQHNVISSHHLTSAANRSAQDHFVGFKFRTLDADGNPAYGVLHNRFPMGGYLLIKLGILPFADDLSAQIHAARLLMLAFFAGAAVLAYLSLCRLVAETPAAGRVQVARQYSQWLALAATCLAFSSFYCLYNSDLITTEAAPDLFMVLLAFHGMVVFMQEGRYAQLLVKSWLPLLIGWHVFALLLPFVVLVLATGVFRMRRGPAWPGAPALAAPANLHRRCLLLGGGAVLLGLVVLGGNLANEYMVLNAQALSELPSFESMLRRLGITGYYAELPWASQQVAWPSYLASQLVRIGSMFIPYCLTGVVDWMVPSGPWRLVLGATVGAVALLACLTGLASLRRKELWATLALFGLCWSLPMRHQAFNHPFASIFYVGLPLLFFSVVHLQVLRRFGGPAVVGLSIAALAVFVLSGAQMAHEDSNAAKLQKTVLADLQRMRSSIVGKVVIVPPNWALERSSHTAIFYLVGSTVLFGYDTPGRSRADYVITPERDDDTPSLTPGNRLMFLYRREAYAQRKPIASRTGGALVRNEHGAVYLHDQALYYERRVSARISRRAPVVGYPFRARLGAWLGEHALPKPWQWQASRDGRHWSDVPGLSKRNREYVPTAADVGARLRARLEYLDSSGEWVKTVSEASQPVLPRHAGAGPRFPQTRVLLHVIPVDVEDLSADDRRRGFERRDFFFESHAIPYQASGLALAVRRLPDYPIAAIRVGETVPGEGVLWSAEVELDGLEASR